MAKPIRVAAIIKVTENCNYNCDFCFYAKKHYDWKKTMTIDMCKVIIRKTSDYNYANGVKKSNIIFHGGEPLIRGIDFFQEMMDFEQKIMTEYPDRTFDNTIQTNASLVDSNWIAFFKKYNFNVGISLDGDGELNYHYATENDEKNIEHIISVYHSMDDAGINVGILSVITEKHSKDTKKFYDFIVNNGIKKIAILPCINDISNYTIKVQALSNFMTELFDLYFYGTYRVTIREFTNVIERALGYTQESYPQPTSSSETACALSAIMLSSTCLPFMFSIYQPSLKIIFRILPYTHFVYGIQCNIKNLLCQQICQNF